jgi:ferredoxin/flavodoxin---NADP+ reductase
VVGWRSIDAAEVARGHRAGRPRNKFTSIGDMLAVAAGAPAPSLRRRLADRLHQLADLS